MAGNALARLCLRNSLAVALITGIGEVPALLYMRTMDAWQGAEIIASGGPVAEGAVLAGRFQINGLGDLVADAARDISHMCYVSRSPLGGVIHLIGMADIALHGMLHGGKMTSRTLRILGLDSGLDRGVGARMAEIASVSMLIKEVIQMT
jgi:hypothetical protein